MPISGSALNGNLSVMKSMLAEITDASNCCMDVVTLAPVVYFHGHMIAGSSFFATRSGSNTFFHVQLQVHTQYHCRHFLERDATQEHSY